MFSLDYNSLPSPSSPLLPHYFTHHRHHFYPHHLHRRLHHHHHPITSITSSNSTLPPPPSPPLITTCTATSIATFTTTSSSPLFISSHPHFPILLLPCFTLTFSNLHYLMGLGTRDEAKATPPLSFHEQPQPLIHSFFHSTNINRNILCGRRCYECPEDSNSPPCRIFFNTKKLIF